MKKILNQIRNKVNELAVRAKCTMESKKAEGYIDEKCCERGCKPWKRLRSIG